MATQLKVQPIKTKRIRFGVVGTSPLIQHAWSDKGLDMMRKTPGERRKTPKVGRDPEGEANAAMYLTDDGGYGVPIMAFKSALIGAAHKDIGLEKTLVRKSLFFVCTDSNGIIPMIADDPICREDIVRVGMGQTDLRYRPEFRGWKFVVTCDVDSDALTEADVINLVNRAGFGVGIGEWRPEKGGEYGRFAIDTTVPMEIL